MDIAIIGFGLAGVITVAAIVVILRLRSAAATARQREEDATRAAAAAKAEAEKIQQQLRDARKDAEAKTASAEAASRAKVAFLTLLSRELRAPMNGITGMARSLRETQIDPRQRELIQTLENSAESLLATANEVFEYSALESGEVELRRAPFNIRQCVEEALELCSATAARKSIELVSMVHPGTPARAEGDSSRVRQVIAILVSNAFKSTHHGQVMVTVGLAKDTPGSLTFTVQDSGTGLPQDELDRLLRPGSRTGDPVAAAPDGAGLGLVIARSLIEMMGGKISAEGMPGRGTTVTFTLQAAALPPAANDPDARQPGLDGVRILLVEDNAFNRQALASLLSTWGLKPTEAPDAKAALALLNNNQRFDIALVDQSLPGADGVSLAEQMKKIAGVETMQVVLLGAPGRSVADNLFTAMLPKPIKSVALLAAVREIIQSRSASSQGGVLAGTTEHDNLGARCPLRILLAEDNPVSVRVTLIALGHLGYGADVAINGREALDALERSQYDVVLMDVNMPEMDGLEATRKIRARYGAAQHPWIIALTAAVQAADRQNTLIAGMDDFLPKPLNQDQLARSLERAHQMLHPAR
jgi:signal transduction histidine kinase/DNA-binding response OmpR family regulator